jgi:hypothetical protein
LRRVALILIAAAVCLLGLAAPGTARVRYSSNLVFFGYDYYPGPDDIRFFGYLTSPGPGKCSKDRKVRLFYKADGADPTIGSTRTDSFEHWHLYRPTEGLPDADDYYARVGKRKLANGDVCKADHSNTIPID